MLDLLVILNLFQDPSSIALNFYDEMPKKFRHDKKLCSNLVQTVTDGIQHQTCARFDV